MNTSSEAPPTSPKPPTRGTISALAEKAVVDDEVIERLKSWCGL